MNTEYTQPSQPFDPERTVPNKVDRNLLQANNSQASRSQPQANSASQSAVEPSIPSPISKPMPRVNPPLNSQSYAPYTPPKPAGNDDNGFTNGRTRMAYAPVPNPRQQNEQKSNTLLWLVGGAAAFGFIVVFAFAALVLVMVMSTPRIPDGTTVGGVNVGGETVDDAKSELAQTFASRTVTVTDGLQSFPVTLAELGISVDVERMVNAAQELPDGSSVPFAYNFDPVQAQNGLIQLAEVVSIPAIDGNPPENGTDVEIPVLLDRLVNDLDNELADGVIELPMIVTEGTFIDDAAYTGVSTTHIVEAGQELGLIAKEYNVSMAQIIELNNISDPDLLFVGQELEIPAAGVYVPAAEDAPAPPTTVGKAIVVSTDHQRIYAYENGQLIHSHLTSTGRPETPTVLGDYKIYVKYVADDMSGPDYFLPQVPYTMYFYQGYGIHGTYWHNNFGRVMSHGCVNLPVDEAKWFFEWAEVGTPVRVV